MSIILEGCDLTGKTTLAEGLNWPIMTRELGKRGRDTLEGCMRLHVGYNLWVRWWMTEYIYDKMLRKQHVCTRLDMWKFKLLADVKGAVIIFFDEPINVLKKRYDQRKEEHSFQYIQELKAAYHQFFNMYNNFLPPFFTNQQVQEALIAHKKLQDSAIRWTGFDVEGWGSLQREQTLIIGERFGPSSRARYPFCFQTNKGCGRYFLEALANTGCDPGEIHVMNLWHQNGSQGDWRGMLELLKPRKIIALGKRVSRELTPKISHTCVPHPQYWKRFHYKDIQEYSKLLKGAIHDC